MTEWIGQLMAGWPVWLTGLVIIIGVAIAGFALFYWSLAEGVQPPFGDGSVPKIRRKKHDKE